MNTPINPGPFGAHAGTSYNPPVHLPAARPSRCNRVARAFGAVIVPALLLAISIGCFRYLTQKQGNGKIVTEQRIVEVDVTSVELVGSPTVNVTVNPQTSDITVEVTTDENLIVDVITEIKDGVLIIRQEGNLDPSKGIRVDVTVRSLNSANLTGSGDIIVSGISGDAFKAQVTGSGDLSLRGTTETADLGVLGSGDLHAEQLDAVTATASVTGSGDISLKARESADLNITGSGDITVHGKPATMTRSVTGSGGVHVK